MILWIAIGIAVLIFAVGVAIVPSKKRRSQPEPHPPHPPQPQQPVGEIAFVDPHALDGQLRRLGFEPHDRAWRRDDGDGRFTHASVDVGDGCLRVHIWLHLPEGRTIRPLADSLVNAQRGELGALAEPTLEVKQHGPRPVALRFVVRSGDADSLARGVAIVDELAAKV
jgi:hypothetical protein